jgi:hypothetical protein
MLASYVFIKCHNEKRISANLTRKDQSLLITPPGSTNSSTLNFTRIFTQYELDALDTQFQRIFTRDTQNYILLYGMPLNIKLFIFHKSVNSFISNVFSSLEPGQNPQNRVTCQLFLLDTMSDLIVKTISTPGEYFIPTNEYSVERIPEYSLFKKFTIK